MKRYYCTYFDRNYFIKGLTLIESLNQHESHPFTLFIVCLDEITRVLLNKMAYPSVVTIPLHQIEEKDTALLQSRHDRHLVEYYWTLTPTILLRLLEWNPDIDVITYLDGDLFFYSSPEPIWDELGTQSILIHEHRFAPEQKSLIQYGKYNVGLLCFRNDSYGKEALQWWRARCIEWCYGRLENGKYGDQLYLDDWPTRFNQVVVLQHIGAGVGPWNHIQYEISQNQEGQTIINDQPLVFYHFHSLLFVHPEVIIPSQYTSNPLTLNCLKLCYIPYTDALIHSIVKTREILPEFEFGINNKHQLDESHTFIARNTIRNEIMQIVKNNPIIYLNDQWDCYTSPQLRDDIQNHLRPDTIQKESIESLPVPKGKKLTPQELLLDVAEQKIQTGNKQEGIQVLFQIVEKWPTYALAYNDLGVIFYQDGNHTAALNYFSKALELNPFDKRLVLNLGRILFQLEQNDSAIMILSNYLNRFHKDQEVRRLLYQIEKPRMLNLGCGNYFHDDWINLDTKPISSSIQSLNLCDPLQFSNETFDVVYHSHVLQHLPKALALPFMKECFRVLKKGGIIRVGVPDLEEIIRSYLFYLDKSINGTSEARQRYHWLLLELLDPMVRNHSGGEIIEYFKQNPIPEEKFIIDRCGSDIKQMIQQARQSNNHSYMSHCETFLNAVRHHDENAIVQLALFRISGEVYHWMYDRYSLKNILKQAGFTQEKICQADESQILDFNTYYLDIQRDGKARKPNSLFMEAYK